MDLRALPEVQANPNGYLDRWARHYKSTNTPDQIAGASFTTTCNGRGKRAPDPLCNCLEFIRLARARRRPNDAGIETADMTREAARLAFSDVRELSDESEALNRIEEVDKERLARSRALRWSKRGMRADGTPWPRYTKRV